MREQDKLKKEEFDRILVTTGPFGRPFIPKIPGVDEFQGVTLHSQAYKG